MSKPDAAGAGTTHRLLLYNAFLMPGLQFALGPAGVARFGLAAAQLGLLIGRRLGPGGGGLPAAPLSALLGRLDPGVEGRRRTLDLMATRQHRQRAREIGQVVAREYDIAALCEVFTPDTRARMRAAMEGQGRPVAVANDDGAGPGVGRVDSGLLSAVIGKGRRLARREFRPFSRQGDPLREGDAWATKGVLLTEVDLGPGRLELYSAHLISGNDALASDHWLLRRRFPRLSPGELLDLRLSQIDDLLAFFGERHDPRNQALIVGDLNLPAQDPASHAALTERMAGQGFHDACAGTQGATAATSADGRSSRLDRLGPVDAGGYLANEQASPPGEERIDYIFAQRPSAEHRFRLELSPVRRRVFPRAPDHPGDERYLSDHVGLETTLTVHKIPD